MFCSQCGKEIADNSKFCPECGKETLSTESKNLKECSLCGKEEGTNSKCAKCYGIKTNSNPNLSIWEKAKLSSEETKTTGASGVIKDNSSFMHDYMPWLVTGLVIILILVGYLSFKDSRLLKRYFPPSNCEEFDEWMIGAKRQNIFGAEIEIISMKTQTIVEEKDNWIKCIAIGKDNFGEEYEYYLKSDGETISYEWK
tara:strand:+ start:71 stop:664 length:594 start_codon:yes stop_codon:yes gene_type:complete